MGCCLGADQHCQQRKGVVVTGGDVLTRLSRISGISDSRWLRWPGPGFRRRRNAEEAVVGASLDAKGPLGYLPGYARVLAIMEWLHNSRI